MNEPKFKVSYGETKGSKQVIFYYVSKVTVAEFNEMIVKEFPGIPETEMLILPGIAYCVVTTGVSLEV
jgi:hypothetical protein